MSRKKICLDDSQTKRLINDTVKLAKGIDDDICPTVREMYEENVDEGILKESDKKRKGKKDILEKAASKLEQKTKRKIKSFFGKIGDLF